MRKQSPNLAKARSLQVEVERRISFLNKIEATVLYMKKLGIGKRDIILMDELRKIRNGIKYAEDKYSLDYATRTKRTVMKVYKKIRTQINLTVKSLQ